VKQTKHLFWEVNSRRNTMHWIYIHKRKHFLYNGTGGTTLTVLVQNGNVSGKETGIKLHTVQTTRYSALHLMASPYVKQTDVSS